MGLAGTGDEGSFRRVHRDGEAKSRDVVADDIHGPRCHVLARNNPVEVDEGSPSLHGEAQANVVSVVRISPAVTIDDDVSSHLIVVWSLATLDDRRRVDAQRHFRKHRRLKDSLRAD